MATYSETLVFGSNQENRAINHAHLSQIQKQLLKSLEIMPPITVNLLTMHVIDGQHRLKGFQTLVETSQLPATALLKVMFVEIPVEEEKAAIIDANTNSKNWSLDDYILSYSKAGLTYYKRLDEWCKKHELANEKGKSKFRYGAAIITGKNCRKELKSGDFTFTEDEIRRAETVHEEMQVIIALLKLKGKGAWLEGLATSWLAVRDQHDFTAWVKEITLRKRTLMKLPKDNAKEWTNLFAQVHLAIDRKK